VGRSRIALRLGRLAAASALVVLTTLLFSLVHAASELLEPEEAFRFSARLIAPRLIEVRFLVADGYYLYKSRLKFRSEPLAVALGEVQLPVAAWHEDEFFGRSEIYRGNVTIRIALESDAPRRFDLVAVSQGCADVGVCYLPTTQRASLFNLTASEPEGGAGGGRRR
jgi:thiol:disulfide interchange protein DsbD